MQTKLLVQKQKVFLAFNDLSEQRAFINHDLLEKGAEIAPNLPSSSPQRAIEIIRS